MRLVMPLAFRGVLHGVHRGAGGVVAAVHHAFTSEEQIKLGNVRGSCHRTEVPRKTPFYLGSRCSLMLRPREWLKLRPSPRLFSVVADSVSLARTTLDRVVR